MSNEKQVTPEDIGRDLPTNTIFVFGSNEAGIHGAGAAKLAYDEYGAWLNQGFGFMAQSFAIPTKDWDIKTLPLDVVGFYISRFIAFAKKHGSDKWKFYVTKIGCGLAGFKVEEIAPFFKEAQNLKNIWLPQDFHDFLDGNYKENKKKDDGPINVTLPLGAGTVLG